MTTIIGRIDRLQHPGVLQDFNWPSDLAPFGRFNLIYGWNGSGKTTLSRLFRHLEQRSAPSVGQVSLTVRGRTIRGVDFPHQEVPIRVFNRDYVDENIFPIGGGEVPPIFVLGADSAKKQKNVENLRTQRTTITSKVGRARARDSQSKKRLDNFCKDQAKVIKDTLQIQGGGFNNFNRSHYMARVTEVKRGDPDRYRLFDQTRGQLLKQHHSTDKPKLSLVEPLNASLVERLSHATALLLQETVVSSSIPVLRQDPQLAAWVREGLRLHKERSSVTCLMCEQPLPDVRVAKLEAHFSAAYEGLLKRIDGALERLKTLNLEMASLNWPDATALYDDLAADYSATCSKLTKRRDDLCKHLAALIEHLTRKKEAPFACLNISAAVPAVDEEPTRRVNEIIGSHNTRTDGFEQQTSDARERLALGMVVARLDEYDAMEKEVHEAAASVESNEAKLNQVLGRIDELEREILEHRRPADELNNELARYLGHNELTIKVRDTGYAIMRGSSVAASLSDGERTALALLYFLKTLTDRRFDAERGVVVLDDPVSSLDANAMYLAFGYIRERTQKAGQLFILTHNFSFFRQVRNWFHHLPGQNSRNLERKPARLYMLSEVVPAQSRRMTIGRLDPLLEQYESEYHYLFSQVYGEAHRSSKGGLERNYYLPNVARRLLESFLAFRLPHIAGDLWKKLQSTKLDEPTKIRVLRFVHTHSHSDLIGDPEHDPALLGEAKSVLCDLLELIQVEDPEHYQAMVSVVESVSARSDNSRSDVEEHVGARGG